MIATSADYATLKSLLGVDEVLVEQTERLALLNERAAGKAVVKNLTTGVISEYHLQPYGWQKIISD